MWSFTSVAYDIGKNIKCNTGGKMMTVRPYFLTFFSTLKRQCLYCFSIIYKLLNSIQIHSREWITLYLDINTQLATTPIKHVQFHISLEINSQFYSPTIGFWLAFFSYHLLVGLKISRKSLSTSLLPALHTHSQLFLTSNPSSSTGHISSLAPER